MNAYYESYHQTSFAPQPMMRLPSPPQANGAAAAAAERHVLAERYKTKQCRNYVVSGVCPYESRCMFAHGDHELRTSDMNLRDGLITEEAIKAFQRALNLRARAASPPPPMPMLSLAAAPEEPCMCDECCAAAAAMMASPPPQQPPQSFTHNPYARYQSYDANSMSPLAVSSSSSELAYVEHCECAECQINAVFKKDPAAAMAP